MFNEAFVADLSVALGAHIDSKWSSSALPQPSVILGAERPVGTETIEQMRDPIFQAEKLGLKRDIMVAKKDSSTVAVWQIKEITAERVQLKEHLMPHEKDNMMDITLTELLEAWRVFKGKVTQPLPGWVIGSSPAQSLQWQAEAIKGGATVAMYEGFERHVGIMDGISVFVNPYMVTAAADHKANSICIVMASQRLDFATSAGCIGMGEFSIGTDTKQLFAARQFVPPLDAKGNLNKCPWVVPFWAIKQVSAAKDANMTICHVPVVVGNITVHVPTMTNKKALAIGTELAVMRWADGYQPAAKCAKRRRDA